MIIKNSMVFWVLMLIPFSIRLAATDYEINPTSSVIGEKYQLKSMGGFRFAEGTFGDSRLAYTNGAVAVSEKDRLVYVSGHAQHFSVGAFALNKRPRHDSISKIPILKNAIPFVKVKPLLSFTKTANIVKSMETIDDHLLVSVDEYYDADLNNREHLVIFEDRKNLSLSKQNGFFEIEGASRAAGWMSIIPAPLSKELGSLYLTGSASNLPINSRQSMGPTLFSWFPFFLGDVNSATNKIKTNALISYSLANPLHKDPTNNSGSNNIWTEVSTAVYGFISPDQKNYIVLGKSGGHNSHIGYKIIQNNGAKCPGFCAYDVNDYYNYYWIYSIEDIKKSSVGALNPQEVRPIKYGKFNLFDQKFFIVGADYSHETNILYLLIGKLDKTQNKFESQPILMLLKFSELSESTRLL